MARGAPRGNGTTSSDRAVARYAAGPSDDAGPTSEAQIARMQDFRRLRVWERAHQFALEVRKVTQSFPRSGYSELKAQLLSAAESIPTNIAEGTGAATRKEFARYLDVSIKSASEVEYHLQLARDNGLLRPDHWRDLSDEVVQIRRMLCALRRKVLAADKDDADEGEHGTGEDDRRGPPATENL